MWKSIDFAVTWSLVTSVAPSWGARSSHGVVVIGNTMILFGGLSGTGF